MSVDRTFVTLSKDNLIVGKFTIFIKMKQVIERLRDAFFGQDQTSFFFLISIIITVAIKKRRIFIIN